MNIQDTRVRVSVFLVGLAVVFGAAWALGTTTTKADGDLALTLGAADAKPGARVPITFTIDDPDGQPVTRFTVRHDKELHLIAVRKDFTGFQHVHPVMAADGTWSTVLDLTSGPWELYADFQRTGFAPTVLRHDFAVSGAYRSAAPAPTTRVARVAGYRVAVSGQLTAGSASILTFTVTRAGKPVTALQPYLGALGHLVILSDPGLEYLHVHPVDSTAGSGPAIGFDAEVPATGRYHLFLNFQIAGQVHTAGFVLVATGSASPGAPATPMPGM